MTTEVATKAWITLTVPEGAEKPEDYSSIAASDVDLEPGWVHVTTGEWPGYDEDGDLWPVRMTIPDHRVLEIEWSSM